MKPDYGDPVPINDDEIPVFWACGVTPPIGVATVKPEFCITHYPAACWSRIGAIPNLRSCECANSA